MMMLHHVESQVLISRLIVMWELPDSQLAITPFQGRHKHGASGIQVEDGGVAVKS
jgi:hypothetical protein